MLPALRWDANAAQQSEMCLLKGIKVQNPLQKPTTAGMIRGSSKVPELSFDTEIYGSLDGNCNTSRVVSRPVSHVTSWILFFFDFSYH